MKGGGNAVVGADVSAPAEEEDSGPGGNIDGAPNATRFIEQNLHISGVMMMTMIGSKFVV